MKMKPFNLEAALAGKPVVTRDGKRVTEIKYFATSEEFQKLYAVVDGHIYNYSDSGTYYVHNDEESDIDLFMEVETVKKYVVYNTQTGSVIPYCIEKDDKQLIYYSGHCDYQIIEFDAEI